MFTRFRSRYIILCIIIFVLFAILAIQLHSLTIAQGETYEEQAQTVSQRSVTLTGARGSILDNRFPMTLHFIKTL